MARRTVVLRFDRHTLVLAATLAFGMAFAFYRQAQPAPAVNVGACKPPVSQVAPAPPPPPPVPPPPAPARRGVPINVRTSSAPPGEYEQLGFLSNSSDQSAILLPLHGRAVHRGRERWQYYTMSDKYNAIRLPVSVGGKNCSHENGCDEVHNGDVVFVEGYNAPFRATIYEKEQYRYIPY